MGLKPIFSTDGSNMVMTFEEVFLWTCGRLLFIGLALRVRASELAYTTTGDFSSYLSNVC